MPHLLQSHAPHTLSDSQVQQEYWAQVFPLYYRVLLLACFALWCWCLNVHGLRIAGIDGRYLIQKHSQFHALPTRQSRQFSLSMGSTDCTPRIPSRAQGALASESRLYHLAFILTFAVFLSWWCYGLVAADDPTTKRWVVFLTLILLVGLVVAPYRALAYPERMRFLCALGRILNPSLQQPVCFGDVVLADILTSFARVFADLLSALCDLSNLVTISWPDSVPKSRPHPPIDFAYRQCGYRVIKPLVIALPYAFRFRQCLGEALASSGMVRRRHIVNAIKYFTSFPVIGLSAYQQYLVWETHDFDGDGQVGRHDYALTVLSHLWLLSAVVNTLHSIYWDMAIDWDLGYTPRWCLQTLLFPSSPNKYWSTARVSRSHSNDSSEITVNSDVSQADSWPMVSQPSSASSVVGDWSDTALTPTTAMNQSSVAVNAALVETVAMDSEHSIKQPRAHSLHPTDLRTVSAPHCHYFLRPRLCFDSGIYYAVVILNVFLRTTWTLKISPHLPIETLPLGGFTLEWLEIARRWLWVYLRIEREWLDAQDRATAVD
ncbi:protein-ER retention protein [Dimargaris xerosporica]|nr:protein-ER retention protein [Dimargaris xerosporica]